MVGGRKKQMGCFGRCYHTGMSPAQEDADSTTYCPARPRTSAGERVEHGDLARERISLRVRQALKGWQDRRLRYRTRGFASLMISMSRSSGDSSTSSWCFDAEKEAVASWELRSRRLDATNSRVPLDSRLRAS